MSSALPSFDDPGLAVAVEQLTPDQLGALPFGVIHLDTSGRVTLYNAAEEALSGKEAAAVVGHPFFTDIAPCMNTPNFRGRIDRAAATGKVDIELLHVGDFSDRDREIQVRVQSASHGGLWIFLHRL
ncbi:MAG: PAS domain-containing protein [Polyangiaceae bacterium]